MKPQAPETLAEPLQGPPGFAQCCKLLLTGAFPRDTAPGAGLATQTAKRTESHFTSSRAKTTRLSRRTQIGSPALKSVHDAGLN